MYPWWGSRPTLPRARSTPSKVPTRGSYLACALPGSWLQAKLVMLRILDIKRRRAGYCLPTCLPVLLCLLAEVAPAKSATTGEEELRSRVEQCYNALQNGDWRKVEKYLTNESKPAFRNQAKKQIPGYEIQSIKIEPDGKTATVTVLVPVVSAATPRPILVPRPTTWRLIGHAWCMDLPRPEPGGQQWVSGTKPPTVRPGSGPVPSKDLKFASTWSGLGNVQSSEVKLASFSFSNVSTHDVTLSDFQLGCPCLRLMTKQMVYKPGESGTVEIEFDRAKLGVSIGQSFEQDIVFKTDPGGAYVRLTISAFLLAPGPAPAAQP